VSNGANWGVSLGLDVFGATFDPSGPHHPRGDLEYAFPTRGWGLRVNGGVVFLKHYLAGGEGGVALMGGERTYPGSNGNDGYNVITQNSIVSSMYVGWITTPMGGTTKVGRRWWLGALLGRERWSGKRQIISCPSCTIDPLKEKSGTFVEPFVVWGGGDKNGGGGFRLAYRTPVLQAPTIRGQFSLGFYFNFLKL
jgi:hypothetical protein